MNKYVLWGYVSRHASPIFSQRKWLNKNYANLDRNSRTCGSGWEKVAQLE